jgi:hypothetical protein
MNPLIQSPPYLPISVSPIPQLLILTGCDKFALGDKNCHLSSPEIGGIKMNLF